MMNWRPAEWARQRNRYFEDNQPKPPYKTRQSDYEAGAMAMLKALEPLIRRMAPSSKLVDILYGDENES